MIGYDRDQTDHGPKFCDVFMEKLRKRNFILVDPRLGAVVFVVCFSICIGIMFGVLTKNMADRKNFTETLCHSTAMSINLFRCCEVGDCNCNTCPNTYLYCSDDLTRQAFNRTACCGGYKCCGSCYDWCTRRVCDSDGKCKTERYKCHFRCCEETSRKTCAVECGTCGNFFASYYTEVNPDANLTYTDECGLDNFKCMLAFEGKFAVGSTWECWYDRTNPTRVRFDGVPKPNIAAWFFFSLFALGLAFCVVVYLLIPLWKVALVAFDTAFSFAY